MGSNDSDDAWKQELMQLMKLMAATNQRLDDTIARLDSHDGLLDSLAKHLDCHGTHLARIEDASQSDVSRQGSR